MTVVTINYNDYKTVIKFIDEIKLYNNIDHIIIVDNCSTDNSYQYLLGFLSEKVKVIQSERNGGYGYGNNFGIKYAKDKFNEKYVLICNPDVKFSEETLQSLINVLLNDDGQTGIVAPVMKNRYGNIEKSTAWEVPGGWQYVLSSVRILKRLVTDGLYNLEPGFDNDIIEVGCVAGSMLLVNVDIFFKCGGYDEEIFLYCEETVLGIKMNNIGKKTKLLLSQYFLHFHSVSISKSIASKHKQEKMIWKSRKYVLKTYYRFNVLEIALVSLLEKFTYIINFIQNKLSRQER